MGSAFESLASPLKVYESPFTTYLILGLSAFYDVQMFKAFLSEYRSMAEVNNSFVTTYHTKQPTF